jgi:hypothetical protein
MAAADAADADSVSADPTAVATTAVLIIRPIRTLSCPHYLSFDPAISIASLTQMIYPHFS